MEKGSNKRKIETIRGIGFFEEIDENGKKEIKPGFGKNITKLSIESSNSAEYNPKQDYMKDLKVEIIGTEGNSDKLLDFIKYI